MGGGVVHHTRGRGQILNSDPGTTFEIPGWGEKGGSRSFFSIVRCRSAVGGWLRLVGVEKKGVVKGRTKYKLQHAR
eukprot:754587-Hanusia_phi.AAC.1